MAPGQDDDAADELAEVEEEKEAQVLRREPLETELMDEGSSGAGEHIDGAERE